MDLESAAPFFAALAKEAFNFGWLHPFFLEPVGRLLLPRFLVYICVLQTTPTIIIMMMMNAAATMGSVRRIAARSFTSTAFVGADAKKYDVVVVGE